jgi:hypothetical protein
LATLMKDNPPTDADAPMVALYRQLSRYRSQPGRQGISLEDAAYRNAGLNEDATLDHRG